MPIGANAECAAVHASTPEPQPAELLYANDDVDSVGIGDRDRTRAREREIDGDQFDA